MFDNPNFPQSFREYKNLIRAEKKWNKCFGIGSNKTATSTLNYIFQNLYGFSSNQSLLEINATIQVMRGNFNPLFNTITNQDFAQDMPISGGLTYVALDAFFPNSKFILTLRDEEKWAKSFVAFYVNIISEIVKGEKFSKNNYLFKGYIHNWMNFYWKDSIKILRESLGNIEKINFEDLKKRIISNKLFKTSIIQKFNYRNNQIIDYFSLRPNDLFVVDLTKEDDITNITSFLEIPNILFSPIPRLDPKSSKKELKNDEIFLDYSKIKFDF
tara:strand:- start:725 stop:1537 length:813 start_codon:yes stop_codon:yes gene_type:complete